MRHRPPSQRPRQQSGLSLRPVIDALNSGAPERGELAARKVLKMQPRNADALHLCGVACLRQGKAEQARDLIRRALKQHKDASFYLNLALAEHALGNEVAEEEAFRNCLHLQPENAQAANNLALILKRNYHFNEAEQLYRQIITNDPNYLPAYQNLSALLREQDSSEAAVSLLEQALTRHPDCAGIQLEFARALEHQKRYNDAAIWFAKTGHWGDLQFVLRSLGSWQKLATVDAALLNQLNSSTSVNLDPWSLLSIPGLSPQLHRNLGHSFAESRWSRQLFAPTLAQEPVSSERLRIGYLSGDFYAHATLHLMMGVLEAHNRARVDIHLFDYSPRREDTFTCRIAESGLPHHDLRELSDEAAAELITEQRLHLLIDLKGYTAGARQGITALRPAPVIVNWLGYPGSLGHPRLADYLIGDPTVTPAEHAEHFSETLALMPYCYQPNDRRRPLSPSMSRSDVGLPERGVVFCSFNQLYKLNPSEFDLWCKLLQAVSGSVLWIMQPETQEACDNVIQEIQARGIGAERLIFAPRLKLTEHLARLALSDLALDSFPCTSHTTASDALWAGVPLMTRLGETFTSRVAGSLLIAHGFPELVATDVQDYFERLKALALDKIKRDELRLRLLAARMSSPLFDTERFTRDLEALYQNIWRHYQDRPERRAAVVTTHNL